MSEQNTPSKDAQAIASAIRNIAHGDVHGPDGLELISMALAGEGLAGHDSVAQALRDGLHEIAQAIRDVSA